MPSNNNKLTLISKDKLGNITPANPVSFNWEIGKNTSGIRTTVSVPESSIPGTHTEEQGPKLISDDVKQTTNHQSTEFPNKPVDPIVTTIPLTDDNNKDKGGNSTAGTPDTSVVNIGTVTASTGTSDSDRKFNVQKQESPVWKSFDNVKGIDRKTTGTGKSQRYYEWDHTHNDIEVYDNKGRHLGSMNPETGEMYKPKVEGRKIDI